MDRSDIEEMAKDLIPLAEETNAGEALMTTDYDDKWLADRRRAQVRALAL